jgi:hypothetical protein
MPFQWLKLVRVIKSCADKEKNDATNNHQT